MWTHVEGRIVLSCKVISQLNNGDITSCRFEDHWSRYQSIKELMTENDFMHLFMWDEGDETCPNVL